MGNKNIDSDELIHFINEVLDESGKIAMKFFRQKKNYQLKEIQVL